MSTSGIGSNVPGFDVLFPSGVSSPASTSSSSTSSSSSSSGQNVYQKTYAGIESWQNSVLMESVEGTLPSTLPLLTDGASVDSFAQLTSELGALNSQQAASGQLGSTVDTTA